MLYRCALIVFLAVVFEPVALEAQTYSEAQPVLSTTNHVLLKRLALEREIHERFRIGFDRELHGRWKEAALGDFSVLLRRDPSYAIGRYDFALAEIAIGRLDDAERELRSALALVPTFARARFALGAVLLRQRKHDEARTAFEQAARDANDVTLRNLALSMRQSL